MVKLTLPRGNSKRFYTTLCGLIITFVLYLGLFTACSDTEKETVVPLSVAPSGVAPSGVAPSSVAPKEIPILNQFSGNVAAVFVQQGQEVQPGYPLFALSNEKQREFYVASRNRLIELESLIPPARLAHIQSNAQAESHAQAESNTQIESDAQAESHAQIESDQTIIPLGAQHADVLAKEEQAKKNLEDISVELAKASLNAHRARASREKKLMSATNLQKNLDTLEKTEQELTLAKKQFESFSLTRAEVEHRMKNLMKQQTSALPDDIIETRVQAYKQQLEQTRDAQKMLEETTVTSPVEGTVLSVNVKEGEQIEQGATALIITVKE